NREGRPRAETALDFDLALQLLDQAADDVEAEPDASVRPPIRAVDLPEHLEDVRQIVAGDAHARVAHAEDTRPLDQLAGDPDLPAGRELEGVAAEVLQDRLQLAPVGRDDPVDRLPPERHRWTPRKGGELAVELLPELADRDEVDRRPVLAGLHPVQR